MNFFTFDLRKIIIVALLLALPLISINMKRAPDEDPWYVQPMGAIVGFFQDLSSSFTSGITGTTSMYLNLIGIKRTNQALLKENAELRAKLGAMSELQLENERLTNLLDFKRNSPMGLISARVIARDLMPDHQTIRINRGAKHGINKFQGVITVDGVIGYIRRVDAETSLVLAITDRFATVDAIVQRTRARGLIGGRGPAQSSLKYLERAIDVSVNDLVVTGNLHGMFPKGFPIGKVSSVKKTDYGLSQEADIIPIVSLTSIEEVFVIVDAGNEDLMREEGPPVPKNLMQPAKQNSNQQMVKPLPTMPAASPQPSPPQPTGTPKNAQ